MLFCVVLFPFCVLSIFKCLKENEAFLEVSCIKEQFWEKLELGSSAPHLGSSASVLEHRRGMIECKLRLSARYCDYAHSGGLNTERHLKLGFPNPNWTKGLSFDFIRLSRASRIFLNL